MNAGNAFSYLIGTLIDLYVSAVMIRLLLQWVRADFYNPLCQFLIKITNPLLVPLRRVIPSIGRLDTASIVLMMGLEVINVWSALFFGGKTASWLWIISFSAQKLAMTLLWMYFFLILIMVILSWVGRGAQHPIVPLIYQLTEPVLSRIRRVIPAIGGLDLSPMFALIAIQFLLRLLGWR